METLSLKQAADAVGKTKPTILKKLQKGEIIGKKNHKNEWVVNVASLCQSYKMLPEFLEKHETVNSSRTVKSETVGNTQGNDNLTHEIIELRRDVKALEQRIEDKEETIKDYKERETVNAAEKSQLAVIIEKQNARLTYQPEQQANIPPPKKAHLGSALLAASVVVLVAVGTIAYVAPEKLDFLSLDKLQQVAALSDVSTLSRIEPAAAPEKPIQGVLLPDNEELPIKEKKPSTGFKLPYSPQPIAPLQ